MDKEKCVVDLDSALGRIAELENLLEETVPAGENLIQKAIINQSPVGISVRDGHGNLILYNAKWVEIWEMNDDDVAEALSRNREKLQMDKKDRYLGTDQSSVRRVYSRGGDLTLDDIYVSRLGKWINQRFYGIKDSSGGIMSVVVLTEDVTDKRRALAVEEELRKSTEKYQTLVRNLPVAAYTTDPEGFCVSANPAMVKMFGAQSEEDIHRVPVWKTYRNPSDRVEFLNILRREGKTDNYEVELLRRDGAPFWASISANVTIDDSGDIQAVDGIIRDISSAKALEAEILKAQKLESIGVLAGGIAHDFNNIMAAVMGNISLAKLYATDNSRISEKLEKAEQACIRASELTGQLLTFSRGGQPVRKMANADQILREAASFALTGSDVTVTYHLPKDLWSVEVDEAQVGQAVNNLVMNSVQATTVGGRIEISAENINLDPGNKLSLDSGHYLKITLADNGIGISPEVQDRIFDPYFTTKPEGSGLGLAAVYSIVKNHGGCVTVESEVGKGSKFFLYLPAVIRSVEQNTQDFPPEMFSAERGSVLVMDDEDSVLEVVTEMLRQHGYRSDAASDGLEAVAMYSDALKRGEKYDLVIMDITVPGGVGGVEALKRMLEIDPSVTAVVASGYANNTVMANCRDYGFIDSIAKPFRIDTLLETVQKAMTHTSDKGE